MQEPSFFHDALQTYSDQEKETSQFWLRVRLSGIWLWEKQINHLLSTCNSGKKKQTFHHFSKLFPHLENCFANFNTLSRIQDYVRTQCKWKWHSFLRTDECSSFSLLLLKTLKTISSFLMLAEPLDVFTLFYGLNCHDLTHSHAISTSY